MTDYIERHGYLWPAGDRHCHQVVRSEVAVLEKLWPLVTDFQACVQAGGNCGVWPNALAQRFATVYTFEPDPANFHCLTRNCIAPNVIKLQAALGRRGEPPIKLEVDPTNVGAHQVDGAGTLPVLAIDDLNLPACGLIYLDIEGYELRALEGGLETIAAHRPVIAIENKALSMRYGATADEVREFILGLDYHVANRWGRDEVFLPGKRGHEPV